jgi:hypothetical protein
MARAAAFGPGKKIKRQRKLGITPKGSVGKGWK